MRTFKVKMVRTYTTEVEVEVETKSELLVILNHPDHHNDQDKVNEFWDMLGEEERDQDKMGSSKFYIKEAKRS